MSYIFGKLWHSAINWPIRKSFQCILQGIRFLLANHTLLSGTSENESYQGRCDGFTMIVEMIHMLSSIGSIIFIRKFMKSFDDSKIHYLYIGICNYSWKLYLLISGHQRLYLVFMVSTWISPKDDLVSTWFSLRDDLVSTWSTTLSLGGISISTGPRRSRPFCRRPLADPLRILTQYFQYLLA